VEETPTNLKNFLKNEDCPKLADVTGLTFKDACTGLVWVRNELFPPKADQPLAENG